MDFFVHFAVMQQNLQLFLKVFDLTEEQKKRTAIRMLPPRQGGSNMIKPPRGIISRWMYLRPGQYANLTPEARDAKRYAEIARMQAEIIQLIPFFELLGFQSPIEEAVLYYDRPERSENLPQILEGMDLVASGELKNTDQQETWILEQAQELFKVHEEDQAEVENLVIQVWQRRARIHKKHFPSVLHFFNDLAEGEGTQLPRFKFSETWHYHLIDWALAVTLTTRDWALPYVEQAVQAVWGDREVNTPEKLDVLLSTIGLDRFDFLISVMNNEAAYQDASDEHDVFHPAFERSYSV